MDRGFYSTGQVARQLGVTPAQVRLLCESGVVAAETTPGGQWRVPAHEVVRLKREGLPPIPRPMPAEDGPPEAKGKPAAHDSELVVRPSTEVVFAQDLVEITKATLEKRRIDRELEQEEDWFRERQRMQEAEAAAERQRNEATFAEQRRRCWMQEWMKYALNSVPSSARGEVEIEVHTEVKAALSKLDTSEPDSIARPLMDAAVRRALRPWKRNQEIKNAIDAAWRKLPWDVKNGAEHTSLKQRAMNALDEAVRGLRPEASYQQIETAALLAVRPMILEYEHQRECDWIVGRMYLFGATPEELEAAKNELRKRLATLPVGAERKELEKAQEVAVSALKVCVARREEAGRLESEVQARRRAAERKIDPQLDHIVRYLDQEYEFDGGFPAMRREAERLRPLIRKTLIEKLLKYPNISEEQIRRSICSCVDDELR
jgi:hypothetical protein